jgi:hypothetical protein
MLIDNSGYNLNLVRELNEQGGFRSMLQVFPECYYPISLAVWRDGALFIHFGVDGVKGLPRRSGFLIMSAASRQKVEATVSRDPFAFEGLIESLTIFEWDPLFGTFAQNLAKR